MNTLRIAANYYQQFDADPARDVPGEGYGGWKKAEIEIAPEHTAIVVMHAWDCGTPEEFPGWYRCVEYLPRANEIVKRVFPPLLSAVRTSDLNLFHVVGSGEYYRSFPGYKRALELAVTEPEPKRAQPDDVSRELREFRSEHVFVGKHNEPDVKRGFERLDFPPEARPVGDEGIAENAHQLYALCRNAGINHLIYVGFAINWCLLMSPGGMLDMSRMGFTCSTIREATTAVENRESARHESHKEEALWRTALSFGFVFDLDDVFDALKSAKENTK
jgi:hypothetical protein